MLIVATIIVFFGSKHQSGNNAVATEHMRIDSAGKVGIGTDAPTNTMHIYKASNDQTTGLFIEKATGASGTASLFFGVTANAGESNNVGVPKAGILFQRTAGNGRGDLKFCVDYVDDTNAVGVADAKMTITGSNGNVVIPGKQYAIELESTLAEADKSATTWYRLLKGGMRTGTNGYSTQCELLVLATGLHECVTFDFNHMIDLVNTKGSALNVYRHDSFLERVGVVKFRLTEYSSSVFYLDMQINHDVVGVDRTWTVNLKVVQGGSVIEAPTTFLEKITTTTGIVNQKEYDIGLAAFAVIPSSNAAPFTIMSTGNVGIGTTSPDGTLHVQTDSRVHITAGTVPAFTGMNATSSATGRAQLVLSSAYSDLVIASSSVNNSHGSTLTFATVNPSNTAEYRKFVINQGNWGDRKDYLDFGLSASTADANPHISINSTDTVLTLDGNNKRVGIGTTTPTSTLDVNGVLKVQGGLAYTNRPIAVVGRNAGKVSSPNVIITNVELYDPQNCHNTSNGRFTVPVGYAGYYLLMFNGIGGENEIAPNTRWTVNGNDISWGAAHVNMGNGFSFTGLYARLLMSCQHIHYLSESDYVNIRMIGGSTYGTDSTHCSVCIMYMGSN